MSATRWVVACATAVLGLTVATSCRSTNTPTAQPTSIPTTSQTSGDKTEETRLPAQDRAGEIVCPTTGGTITLDGRLDDEPWAKAAETGPLVVIGSMRQPDRDRTAAKLVHDEKALYLAVTCEAAPAAGSLPAQARDHSGIWDMGRGPKDIHTHLLGDLLVVRLRGVLTAAEQQLVKTVHGDKGGDLLKQVRTQLMETARLTLEAMVQERTGVKVVSLHHDISTVTGEEVIPELAG